MVVLALSSMIMDGTGSSGLQQSSEMTHVNPRLLFASCFVLNTTAVIAQVGASSFFMGLLGGTGCSIILKVSQTGFDARSISRSSYFCPPLDLLVAFLLARPASFLRARG